MILLDIPIWENVYPLMNYNESKLYIHPRSQTGVPIVLQTVSEMSDLQLMTETILSPKLMLLK